MPTAVAAGWDRASGAGGVPSTAVAGLGVTADVEAFASGWTSGTAAVPTDAEARLGSVTAAERNGRWHMKHTRSRGPTGVRQLSQRRAESVTWTTAIQWTGSTTLRTAVDH